MTALPAFEMGFPKRSKQAQVAHSGVHDPTSPNPPREKSARPSNSLKATSKRYLKRIFPSSKRNPSTKHYVAHSGKQTEALVVNDYPSLGSKLIPIKAYQSFDVLQSPRKDIFPYDGRSTELQNIAALIQRSGLIPLIFSMAGPKRDTSDKIPRKLADVPFQELHGTHPQDSQEQGLFQYSPSLQGPATISPALGPSNSPVLEALVGVGSRFGQHNVTEPTEMAACITRDSPGITPRNSTSCLNLQSTRLSGDKDQDSSFNGSIFSRRSSSASSATSIWEPPGGIHHGHVLARPYLRRYTSAPSLKSRVALLEPNQECRPMRVHSLPLESRNVPSPLLFLRSWADYPNCVPVDYSRARGWAAQSKTPRGTLLPEAIQEEMSSNGDSEHPSNSQINVHDSREPVFSPDISILDSPEERSQNLIQAVNKITNSYYQSNASSPSSSSKGDSGVPMSISHGEIKSDQRTEQSTDFTSSSSEYTKNRNQTPPTSVGEDGETETVESVDMSGADESVSDITDETEESFYQAFSATSLDTRLLPLALALKNHIVSLVLASLIEWLRNCPPGQTAGGGSSNPGTVPNTTAGARSSGSSTNQNNGHKKRGLNGGNASDKDSGDDREKRRRLESQPADKSTARLAPQFACPFVKVYPELEWPKCQKGWPSVHRIKYVVLSHLHAHARYSIELTATGNTFTGHMNFLFIVIDALRSSSQSQSVPSIVEKMSVVTLSILLHFRSMALIVIK